MDIRIYVNAIAALLFFGIACSSPDSHETKGSPPAFETVYGLVQEGFDFIPIADDGFDFPVGPPDAKGYYNAQPFGESYHLGDDWNGVGGGNTDLGDPVYAIANGRVVFAEYVGSGWGNVIRIWHRLDSVQIVESVYAHLDTIEIAKGDSLAKGNRIGTIGTADGAYLAHLHLEIRIQTGLPIGGGYSTETSGFTDPTAFIRGRRGKRE